MAYGEYCGSQDMDNYWKNKIYVCKKSLENQLNNDKVNKTFLFKLNKMMFCQ